ncbi:hypothetical protein KIN20_015141 [Parelaphostrongylus tenuis]|uniref:Uncharacterized protein n=1 Tax=Parelaphostrongylus tenuis TaxID=148309 RepID=A0AAD5MFP2_PARTN|nr:hypothetical protein KIN20_015141 [Parelaphostrongylus tenuis]
MEQHETLPNNTTQSVCHQSEHISAISQAAGQYRVVHDFLCFLLVSNLPSLPYHNLK